MREISDPQHSNRKTVGKYLFPAGFYEHDTGTLAYLCAFPIEGPYRLGQIAKDAFFHIAGMEHEHLLNVH
ncbi:MAG TPA: hypothetical protein VJ485_03885 [archaeon]|nr:hypothetical protein [archaeon]